MSKPIHIIFCLFTAALILAAGGKSLKAADARTQEKTPTGILDLLDEAPPPAEKIPAPGPVTLNDFANQYYRNCRQQEGHLLDARSLDLLCGCASANLTEIMTIDQVHTAAENTPEGQHQRDRLLLFAYTPCFQHAIKDLTKKQCMNNPKIKSNVKYYPAVCACFSENMGDFMKEKAPEYVQSVIGRGPHNGNVLRTLMESRVYEERSRYHMNRCLHKHEYPD